MYDREGNLKHITENNDLNGYFPFSINRFINLEKNENLNELAPGAYRAVDDATIISLANKPIENITLIDDIYIIAFGDNVYEVQLCIGIGTSTSNMWIRGKSGNSWKPWKEL